MAQCREIAEAEDEGSERPRHRRGGADDRRLGPLDGPRGGGVGRWQARASGSTAAEATIDRDKLHPLAEAVQAVKANAKAKFDETIELALNLGVDPRHADQMVRGTVNLPHGTGKTLRVARVRPRRQGRRGQGRRRRRGRCRGSGRAGPGGADRLRPLHRDAGHDAAGRPARPGPGPARPDAEPEARHGDAQRRARRSRPPRAARCSSGSRRPGSCMRASARRASRPEHAGGQRQGVRRRDQPRPSRPAPRAPT